MTFLSVLLLILKILGIIIAVIVGIILLVIILVLFTPVTYAVSAKGKDEDMNVVLKVKWLGGLVGLEGGLEGLKPEIKTKVAGIVLKKKENSLFSRIAKKVGAWLWDVLKKSLFGTPSAQPQESVQEEDSDLPAFVRAIKKAVAKIKKAWERAKTVKYILGAPVTARAWKYFKSEFYGFLLHIKPRSMKGTAVFGTGDPATTAQAYGITATVAMVLDDRLVIVPEMEEKTVDLDLVIKGRLFVSFVLSFLWKLLTHRDIRRVVGYIGRNL